MRVEPRELVGGRPPQRDPNELLVGKEYVELEEQLLCFAPGVGGF